VSLFSGLILDFFTSATILFSRRTQERNCQEYKWTFKSYFSLTTLEEDLNVLGYFKRHQHFTVLNCSYCKISMQLFIGYLLLTFMPLQVRLNFLSTLLDEAYGFLHSFLTASLLNCKLFRQSFNRGVTITAQKAVSMRAALSHCQQVSLWRRLILYNIPWQVKEKTNLTFILILTFNCSTCLESKYSGKHCLRPHISPSIALRLPYC